MVQAGVVSGGGRAALLARGLGACGDLADTRLDAALASERTEPVWWPDARRYDKGDPIAVAANDNITGIDVAL